jgi:nicotinate-nucleotide adenylyltransferase
MRIAVFGGSFNPVHVAHQLVALYVRETQPVDEVWLVPTYQHPFGKPLASYEDRVAMCELAAADIVGARVCRAEETLAKRPGFVASRTLDLAEYLAEQGDELRLVIGSDILAETHKWHRWDDLAKLAPPIVIGRSGHPHAGVLDMPSCSSTEIRALLASGDARVSGLLPAQVLRYIAAHKLYL